MNRAIEAARAALSRAMEGSDRTAVTEAARRLGFAEGVEAGVRLREAAAPFDRVGVELFVTNKNRDFVVHNAGLFQITAGDFFNLRVALDATGAEDAAEERDNG